MLKLYFDVISQPARAVYIFLKLSGAEFQECAIALRKAEHLGAEFTSINPIRKVPVLDDGGFVLTESAAILQYLCSTLPGVQDHWYPKDPKLRARVDEFLSFYPTTLRANGAVYFRQKERVLPSEKKSEDQLVPLRKGFERALADIENYYLKNGSALFIGGLNNISIADLFAVCEIEQLMAAGYDIRANHLIISDYMDRVSKRIGGTLYEDAHKYIRRVGQLVAQGKL